MRPVINAPIPSVNGIPKVYRTYQEWRIDLVNAYGQHCIYCNDRLPGLLQVEHLSPQSLGTQHALDWNNLYLACGPCNLAKSDKVINHVTHYLPNYNNTHFVFIYVLRPHATLKGKFACVPIPNPALEPAQFVKTENLISDLELNRVEQNPLKERKMTDVRWQNRFDVYELANTQRRLWDSLKSTEQKAAYLECVQPMVLKSGFFSLWLLAFQGIPEVLEVIIHAFPSTAVTCFDKNDGFKPIPRNPHNPTDPI